MNSLQRLSELHEQATEPPWYAIGYEVSKPEVDIVRWAYHAMPPAEHPESRGRAERDAELIAAMRNALPALLALVDAGIALRERVAKNDAGEFDWGRWHESAAWDDALERLKEPQT